VHLLSRLVNVTLTLNVELGQSLFDYMFQTLDDWTIDVLPELNISDRL
jgi:uncharacterized protein involved in cysteine biosynthesis